MNKLKFPPVELKIIEGNNDIYSLGLSARTRRSLYRSGIKNIDILKHKSDQELLSVWGIGDKSLAEIREKC